MSAHALSCPSPERLSRALTEGADEALRQHLAGCARCRAEWDAEARLVGNIKQVRVPEPDRDRLEAARSALLARAPRQPTRRRPPAPALWSAAIAACALAAVFARGWLDHRGEHRGTVVALGAARFLHEDAKRDEVVRLSDGEIHVEVEPLRKGERFRVVVGDAEVEVRGTSFDISASGDRLQRVRVQHGVIEVRPTSGPVVLVRAGERWAPSAERAPATGPISTAEARSEAPASALPPVGAAIAAPPAAGPAPGAAAAPETKPASPAVAPGPMTRVARPATYRPAKLARRGAAAGRDGSATAGRAGGATAGDGAGDAGDGASGALAGERTGGAGAPAGVAAAPRSAATEQRPATAGAPRAEAAPAASAPPTAGVPVGTAADRTFAAGWQALRARDYRGAAVAFGQTVKLAGEQPLAEDARYWLAVSQARAGQREAAIVSLRAFVARHPQSPRAAEAASMLGWQLMRGGAAADLEEAERLFRAAAMAPLRQVRESAHAGLTAVGARRAAANRDR